MTDCSRVKGAPQIRESHLREWLDLSSPAYRDNRAESSPESHPREWVDRSNPAYEVLGQCT